MAIASHISCFCHVFFCSYLHLKASVGEGGVYKSVILCLNLPTLLGIEAA